MTQRRPRDVATVEGSRTRQLAQTEKQIAVVLMPLVPFFIRDGCRSPYSHRALRMLPFAEQGKCSLVLLATRSATARGFQQQPWRAVPFDARSTLPAPLDFRSKCFLSSGFVGCVSAMRSRVTVCLRSASPALSQLSPWWLCRHLAHACIVNSFGDPRKRFSLGCQPLDSKRMLRAYS